jgi:hypothetical protein
MKIRARALGLTIGSVSGVGIFILTLLSVLRGSLGATLGSLMIPFYGYTVSYGGAFIGLIWGFVYGFICGAFIALLYNAFHKMLYKKEASASQR